MMHRRHAVNAVCSCGSVATLVGGLVVGRRQQSQTYNETSYYEKERLAMDATKNETDEFFADFHNPAGHIPKEPLPESFQGDPSLEQEVTTNAQQLQKYFIGVSMLLLAVCMYCMLDPFEDGQGRPHHRATTEERLSQKNLSSYSRMDIHNRDPSRRAE